MKIKVVGMDPSLRNWGMATGTYCTEAKKVTIHHLMVTQAEELAGKQTRQNSKDIHVATQLFEAAAPIIPEAQALFVEVPVGSQSARSMASYGICVGVLGSLRGSGVSFYEVTPTEVKLASAGHKTATKQEMIQWATQQHPEAPWPTQTVKGQTRLIESKAEHMADAIAAIYAGIKTTSFQQALAFWTQSRLSA